jgi:hypothetical protein
LTLPCGRHRGEVHAGAWHSSDCAGSVPKAAGVVSSVESPSSCAAVLTWPKRHAGGSLPVRLVDLSQRNWIVTGVPPANGLPVGRASLSRAMGATAAAAAAAAAVAAASATAVAAAAAAAVASGTMPRTLSGSISARRSSLQAPSWKAPSWKACAEDTVQMVDPTPQGICGLCIARRPGAERHVFAEAQVTLTPLYTRHPIYAYPFR